MKRTIGWLLVALVLASASAGCVSRGIKEAVGVARGAKGIYAPIQPVAQSKEARPLGDYTRFELGKFTDDMDGKSPASLLGDLRVAFDQTVQGSDLPNRAGGKTLLVRGRILHYENADMVGQALGPLEEVVARVQLVDKDSGNVLGEANCIGRTTESVNTGVEKKAQGLAKAIVDWIVSRYPVPEE